MQGRRAGTGLVLGGFAALLLAGCASEGSMRKTGSGDIVADRQRVMKNKGANWQDIQNKFKAGNLEGIAVNAENLAIDADQIPALFPPGSLTEKSKAKPEIWQKWPEFEAASKNLETWSVRLRDASQKKDQAQVDAIMKDFGRQACGTCHTPFRVPPPARS
jgi:cytochrome c556